jgi:subtilisin family serine protease
MTPAHISRGRALGALGVLASAALLAASAWSGERASPAATTAQTHVVVALTAPPLARATGSGATASRRIRLEQARFERALRASVPSASVHWRYRVVENGVSVVLPTRAVGRLRHLPAVTRVFPAARYTALVGPAGGRIRARELPGIVAAQGGAGIKIGVIDDGLDQTHPFFAPTGYVMPDGFPKGSTRFTTAKVIVARAFPPPGSTYARAALPFDDGSSYHGTHVAGIAAGNEGTSARGARIAGVAPRAWLGNYKALTIPTDAGVGLDGNAPELVAAIEAAVVDGMDVINLSLGEPEIEPDEDVVARALDAAAAAGVVPVVAAGNDYDDFGAGSVSSPGTSADAITVAAVTDDARPAVASFSGGGPTALSLRAKPDVAAPGVGILSSVPGGWDAMSGTSMAAPHVAGAAALLLQAHPDWPPATIKAALVGTSRPIAGDDGQAPATRVGAGLVDVRAALAPQLVAAPAAVSFGLLRSGTVATATIELADVPGSAGGAGTAGAWQVTIERTGTGPPAEITAPSQVTVPQALTVTVATPTGAADGELTGVVVLRREGITRRIPFWARVATPRLTSAPATLLRTPGLVTTTTRGQGSRVVSYRYPDVPPGGRITARLRGPERVFRVRVDRPIANFGVVIVSRGAGVTVEPRVVVARDENRLTGYAALPVNLNPYLAAFGERTLVAGALVPAPGVYDVVFDSASARGAGGFTFRFWIDDRTRPSARLLTRSVRRGEPILVRVADAGSGVDPSSVAARLGRRSLRTTVASGVARIATTDLQRGTHTIRFQISDYQETRNFENVARILPNTRVLTARVVVR